MRPAVDPIVLHTFWEIRKRQHHPVQGKRQAPTKALSMHVKCIQSSYNIVKKVPCMHKVPHTGPFIASQISPCDQLLCTYSKKTREGFCNYKRLCILCLSHALIQLQCVCCFARDPESRLPTAVYLEVFPKCVEVVEGHQQTLRSRVETPNCRVSRGVP